MAARSPSTGEPGSSVAELGHRRLEAAEEAVNRWESWGAAVDTSYGVSYSARLVAAVKELISLVSDGGAYAQRAMVALQTAAGHLEDDFRQVLCSGQYFHPPGSLQASLHDCIALPVRSFSFSSIPNSEDLSSSSFTTNPSEDSRTSRGSVSLEKVHMYLIDPEASILLKEIAELMILAGHAPNLCHAYGEIRQNALMQCLCLLGVQIEPKSYTPRAASAEGGCNMQLYGQKLKMWIQALRVIVGTVLPEERQACAQIFGCDSKVEEDCFARATTRCTQQLLAIGSVMANVKDQQYDTVPLLLQMHEEFESFDRVKEGLLSGDAKNLISQEADMLRDKLGKAALRLLLDFLNVWFNHEPYERTLFDGGILSLTQHVMGFIKLLAEYNNTINLILSLDEEEEDGIGRTMSPWERYVLMLLARLQLRIEEKSGSYKDERLRYIFLMNNAMYVRKSSRCADLSMPLGDDRNQEQLVLLVEKYAIAYLRASWTGALLHLRTGVLTGPLPTPGLMRKRFKNFNSAFGEIIRVQTTWKVPDPQLRQHLRILTLQQVLPLYSSFLGRFSPLLESKYIKYTTEDIENHVLNLFEGL